MNKKFLDGILSFFLFLLSTSIGLGTAEVLLRAKIREWITMILKYGNTQKI